MLNYISIILTKTIGQISWPYSHKLFDLRDFPMISDRMSDACFIPMLVTNYGNFGSNILIKIAQYFGVRKWSKKTHVVIGIGNGVAVEASGSKGIREVTLLEAIGQRDEVMILQSHLGNKIDMDARSFLIDLIETDKKNPIKYDNNHDLNDSSEYDCSEVFFNAFNYGLKESGLAPINPVKRFGRDSFSPVDVERCSKLVVLYDSASNGFK